MTILTYLTIVLSVLVPHQILFCLYYGTRTPLISHSTKKCIWLDFGHKTDNLLVVAILLLPSINVLLPVLREGFVSQAEISRTFHSFRFFLHTTKNTRSMQNRFSLHFNLIPMSNFPIKLY